MLQSLLISAQSRIPCKLKMLHTKVYNYQHPKLHHCFHLALLDLQHIAGHIEKAVYMYLLHCKSTAVISYYMYLLHCKSTGVMSLSQVRPFKSVGVSHSTSPATKQINDNVNTIPFVIAILNIALWARLI